MDIPLNPLEFLKHYPEDLRKIALYLRDLVRSTCPDSTEKVIPGWRVIGYRAPYGKKSVYFCCIAPQIKEHDVLLGFEYGIAMKDPKRLMEGKGTQVRFVRVRPGDQYVDEDLIWLIEHAEKVAIDFRTGR